MTRIETSFQIEKVQPYWNLGIHQPKRSWIDGFLEGTETRGLIAQDVSSFLVPLDIIRFVKGRGGTTAAALDHLLAQFPQPPLRHPSAPAPG